METKMTKYIRAQLLREPEEQSLTLPQRAKRGLVWFFAVFLALTMLSRCASDALVAQVTVKDVSGGSIDQSITGEGDWRAADLNSQWAQQQGLRVNEVFVGVGDAVAQGDSLYSLEESSVLARQKELSDKIAQYNLQISQLYASQTDMTGGAKLSLDQAKADLAAAQTALTGAEATINATKKQAYTDAVTSFDTQRALQDGQLLAAQQAVDAATAALDPALPETQAALTQAQTNLASLTVQWATALAEAQRAVDAAKAVSDSIDAGSYDYSADLLPYETAVDAAKRIVDTSQVAYDQAVRSSGSASASAGAQAGSIQIYRNAEQENLNAINSLLENACVVKSASAGTVTDVTVKHGDLTGSGSAVTLSTQGLVFYFTMSADEAEGVSVGDAVTIYTDGKAEREKLKISAIGSAGEGAYEARCEAADGGKGRALGAKQNFRLERSTQRQDIRVPIQALRQDGAGKYYVLIIGGANTVLGLQTVAERVDVTLLSHDESFAAVEGSLSQETEIIVASDKPISDGDRVEVDNA